MLDEVIVFFSIISLVVFIKLAWIVRSVNLPIKTQLKRVGCQLNAVAREKWMGVVFFPVSFVVLHYLLAAYVPYSQDNIGSRDAVFIAYTVALTGAVAIYFVAFVQFLLAFFTAVAVGLSQLGNGGPRSPGRP